MEADILILTILTGHETPREMIMKGHELRLGGRKEANVCLSACVSVCLCVSLDKVEMRVWAERPGGGLALVTGPAFITNIRSVVHRSI